MQISCNLILKSPMQKNSIDNLERKRDKKERKYRKRDKKERKYRKRERKK